jgi:hypothetical protein
MKTNECKPLRISIRKIIFWGGSVAYLKNDKGVVIKLHSQTGGLRFNLAAEGMHITLQQP